MRARLDTADDLRGASSSATIDCLTLADEPAHWRSLGFTVSGSTMQLGSVSVELVGPKAGLGILGWSLRDVASVELDGLPTAAADASKLKMDAAKHANAIVAIDHVVAMSPDLDRGVHALRSAGLDLRRIREQPTPAGAPRQAFFRLGEVILELVQEPDEVLAARGTAEADHRASGDWR